MFNIQEERNVESLTNALYYHTIIYVESKEKYEKNQSELNKDTLKKARYKLL